MVNALGYMIYFSIKLKYIDIIWKLQILTNNSAKITTWFFFVHVITHFGIPKQLMPNHGTHFENDLFQYLSRLLGFVHEFSVPYHP